MTTKTKRLSAEAIRQREEDGRRFLNLYKMYRVADALVYGQGQPSLADWQKTAKAAGKHFSALRAMQPAWTGETWSGQ